MTHLTPAQVCEIQAQNDKAGRTREEYYIDKLNGEIIRINQQGVDNYHAVRKLDRDRIEFVVAGYSTVGGKAELLEKYGLIRRHYVLVARNVENNLVDLRLQLAELLADRSRVVDSEYLFDEPIADTRYNISQSEIDLRDLRAKIGPL